ncbi:MAG: hypothetical protein LN588_01195 [Rickettsia endosymbiont of Bryobia graminum]|nr:hypothetical protein [Rickettsia endosymbiont of Bryobia graminum]
MPSSKKRKLDNDANERKDITNKKVKIISDSPQPSAFNNLMFKGRKSSGANDAGKYGGVYTDKDGNLSMIKRESNFSKNISEFLGSQIFQELSPDSGAKVSLIAPDYLSKEPNQKNGIQNDGSEIYVKSDYIKNYSADMYVDMDKHMSEKTRPSRLLRKEGNFEMLGRPLFAGSRKLLNRAFKEIPYQGFEKIAPASLVIGDFDMHVGNIGVVRDSVSTSIKPKLVRIDFAGSLDKLEKNIHPHSWSRHLPLRGPTNHFREFPHSLKNNIFADSLLATSNIDLDKTIDKSFAELSKYYNEQALVKWAKMAMPYKFKNIPAEKIKIDDIKDMFKETMKQRQKSAKEYGLQIKLSFITKKGRINNVELKKLIQEYPDYFNDLVNKKTKLKLRGNTKSKISNLFFRTKKLLLKEVSKVLQKESKAKKITKATHLSIKKTPTEIIKNPSINSNANTNQVTIPEPLQESLITIKNDLKKHVEPPITNHNKDLIQIAENLSKNLEDKNIVNRKSLINNALKDNLTSKEQISVLKYLLNIEETKITNSTNTELPTTKGNVQTKVFIFDKIANLNQEIEQNNVIKSKKSPVKGL